MNVITFGGARHGREAELSNHQFERLFDQQDANELVPTLNTPHPQAQARHRPGVELMRKTAVNNSLRSMCDGFP